MAEEEKRLKEQLNSLKNYDQQLQEKQNEIAQQNDRFAKQEVSLNLVYHTKKFCI